MVGALALSDNQNFVNAHAFKPNLGHAPQCMQVLIIPKYAPKGRGVAWVQGVARI